MQGLTDRQAQVLKYIQDSITERGYPPTLREIGLVMGIRSTNGVNDHLRALERKGFLTREDMKSRALRPINVPAGLANAPPRQEAGPPLNLGDLGSLDARDVFALCSAIHRDAITMRDAAPVMRGAS